MKKILITFSSVIIALSMLFSFNLSASAASYKTLEGAFNYSYASQVLELVNKERTAYGLSKLTMTQELTDSAMLRAAETAVSFSHTRPNGESCFTAFEWSYYAGENIAYGQRTPSEVVTAWMNSSGHRANILSSNFKTIGIGCFVKNGICYWSQAFSGGGGSSYLPNGNSTVSVDVSLTAGVLSRAYFNVEKTTQTTSKQQETTSTVTQTTTRETTSTTVRQSTTNRTTVRVTQSTTERTTQAKPETTTQPETTTAVSTTEGSAKNSTRQTLSQILKRLLKYIWR